MMGLVGEGNEKSVAEKTSALAFLTHLLAEIESLLGEGPAHSQGCHSQLKFCKSRAEGKWERHRKCSKWSVGSWVRESQVRWTVQDVSCYETLGPSLT